VWFDGECFDSLKDLLDAWRQDEGGMRTGFEFKFPGVCQVLLSGAALA
jgi:hypothetical protein